MKTIKFKEEKKGWGGGEKTHTQGESIQGWMKTKEAKKEKGGKTYTQGKNIQGLMKNQVVKRENEGKKS